MFKRLKDKKGIALILFLALLLMLTVIGVLAISNSLTNLDVSGNRNKTSNLMYAAEAGVEKAVAKIRYYYEHDTTLIPISSFPLYSDTFVLGQDSVGYYTQVDSSSTLYGTYAWDDASVATPPLFRGLASRSTSYKVVSEAWNPNLPNKTRIRQYVTVYHILLSAFSAVYDTFDLEISPEYSGIGMSYTMNGPIHTNRNLYVEAPGSMFSSELRIQGNVSARGAIFHGRIFQDTWPTNYPLEWGLSPLIYIRDALGGDRLMKTNEDPDNGAWIDHNFCSWIDSSLTKWGGTVEDSAHKISDLNLKMVLPAGKKPYDLIGRMSTVGNVSFEYQASLHGMRIYLPGPYVYSDTNGTGPVNCTSILYSATNNDTFAVINKPTYDFRESTTVACWRVDIQRVIRKHCYPYNGIIYVTRTVNPSGTMITNADSLPKPTTIVSPKPIYIVGNFNTRSNVPAAIIADAVTILSGNPAAPNPLTWTRDTTLARRTATNTTVNATIITGNRITTSNNYSGGLWNLARLLENWGGNGNLTINGSLACFWRSQIATKPYKLPTHANPYYVPPFPLTLDHTLPTVPPGMPLNAPGMPRFNLVVKTRRTVEEL